MFKYYLILIVPAIVFPAVQKVAFDVPEYLYTCSWNFYKHHLGDPARVYHFDAKDKYYVRKRLNMFCLI